jgi:hypothetical protein
MTRKDYVVLAAALNHARPDARYYQNKTVHAAHYHQWLVTCNAVADALAADNPRFNADLFAAATCNEENI